MSPLESLNEEDIVFHDIIIPLSYLCQNIILIIIIV